MLSKLFQSGVEYLGHQISREGVSKISEYVKRIKDWLKPKTGKEVLSFLGIARFYHTLIPQYSALINRLKKIKMAENFTWNEEIEKNFEELKKTFTEGGIQG